MCLLGGPRANRYSVFLPQTWQVRRGQGWAWPRSVCICPGPRPAPPRVQPCRGVGRAHSAAAGSLEGLANGGLPVMGAAGRGKCNPQVGGASQGLVAWPGVGGLACLPACGAQLGLSLAFGGVPEPWDQARERPGPRGARVQAGGLVGCRPSARGPACVQRTALPSTQRPSRSLRPHRSWLWGGQS